MAQVLQNLSGVSTVFGLLAVVAYFFFLAHKRKSLSSIREAIEGERTLNPKDVSEIISQFSESDARLAALKELLSHDNIKAKRILDKVESGINVHSVINSISIAQGRLILISGIIFLLIGAFGAIFGIVKGGSETRNNKDVGATDISKEISYDALSASTSVTPDTNISLNSKSIDSGTHSDETNVRNETKTKPKPTTDPSALLNSLFVTSYKDSGTKTEMTLKAGSKMIYTEESWCPDHCTWKHNKFQYTINLNSVRLRDVYYNWHRGQIQVTIDCDPYQVDCVKHDYMTYDDRTYFAGDHNATSGINVLYLYFHLPKGATPKQAEIIVRDAFEKLKN